MKPLILFVFLLMLLSCDHTRNVRSTLPDIAGDAITNQYSDTELITFLDSLGKLDPETLNEGITAISDSVYRSHKNIARSISPEDFEALKEDTDISNYDLFRRVFPQHAEFFDKVFPPVIFHHFSEKKFDKFAVEFNADIGSWVYFFSENKIISIHEIYHKYGLEMDSFINEDGKVVVYYKVNFLSGTGIWHFNYNFYMYDGDVLIPVLNELENANLRSWGTPHEYWFESSITSTNPLTLKTVYEQALRYSTAEMDTIEGYPIVKDSTFVKYNWDKSKKQYIPDFEGTELSSNIILSYYLTSNELLFINTHYAKLKNITDGNDTAVRKIVLRYLDIIKEGMTEKRNEKE